jgi:hypothetical protein
MQPRGRCSQRRRRRPLRVRLARSLRCSWPLRGRARRRMGLLQRAAPGRCTRVWSAHRRAVGSFSVGTYTFTCATDCAATTCSIYKPSSNNYGGTLPDVFDRLTCASKITRMCAPSACAAPGPIPICVWLCRCAPARARVCCVRVRLRNSCICDRHTCTRARSTRARVSSGLLYRLILRRSVPRAHCRRLQPRACACVFLCVAF